METEREITILQSNFNILRWHGLWPEKGKKMSHPMHRVKLVFILLSYLPILLGSALHFIHTFATGANYIFLDVITDAAIVCSGSGMFFIIINFLLKGEMIENLLLDFADFSRFEKPSNFDETNKKLNLLSKALYCYTATGVVIFVTIGLYTTNTCEAVAEKYDVETICGLMAPTWLPFDIKSKFRFWTYFIVLSRSTFCLCTSATLIMGFVFSVSELLVVKINHLKAHIDKAFFSDDHEENWLYFGECIQYHNHVIRTAEAVNDVFGSIVLLHATFASIIIALVGFQVLLMYNIKEIIHVVGWTLAFFAPCLAGQRIINASETIPFHIYSTPWYTQKNELQKSIILSITRANYSLGLNAKGFGNMSMAIFTSVIQTAYSVLAMLHRTTDYVQED